MIEVLNREQYIVIMAMKENWRNAVTAGLDLLFPPSCPCCKEIAGDNDRPLCRECRSQLKFIKTPYCSCCGRVFPGSGNNHLCGDCLNSSWAFDKARSLFSYEKIIAGLIHKLKYAGDMNGLEAIEWMSGQSGVLQDLDTPDIILPVPLHIKRLRQRGFNQAMILAQVLFPHDRRKIRFDLLSRQANTTSQAGLSGIERRKNLRNAFSVKIPSEIAEKKTLIIDDVFTTGSTVNECAKALKTAGCKRVEILTICRADKILA